jgi:hypothetical protein
MKKYRATSLIITFGKIFYLSVFIIGIIGIVGGIASGDFGTSLLVALGIFLYGILIMFSVELLTIFRDIATNTSKTNELLENKK